MEIPPELLSAKSTFLSAEMLPPTPGRPMLTVPSEFSARQRYWGTSVSHSIRVDRLRLSGKGRPRRIHADCLAPVGTILALQAKCQCQSAFIAPLQSRQTRLSVLPVAAPLRRPRNCQRLIQTTRFLRLSDARPQRRGAAPLRACRAPTMAVSCPVPFLPAVSAS